MQRNKQLQVEKGLTHLTTSLMTQKTHTLPVQLYVNYSKVKKEIIFWIIITCVFSYYNTLWTDITKILREKVGGVSNLALIILFIISHGTGKWSPTGISHCSCFNPPPLIWATWEIKDRASLLSDVVPHCRAVRRSKQHKALCLPGLR